MYCRSYDEDTSYLPTDRPHFDLSNKENYGKYLKYLEEEMDKYVYEYLSAVDKKYHTEMEYAKQGYIKIEESLYDYEPPLSRKIDSDEYETHIYNLSIKVKTLKKNADSFIDEYKIAKEQFEKME